jgi:REP element-mobilizing transposase RayT
MAKMPGYMITWTTYGSWLQGDERGCVKNRNVLGKDEGLRKANVERLRSAMVELSQQEHRLVREAILAKAEQLGQKVLALAVCSNHVHVVAECMSESIEMVVSHYENAARLALRANGFVGRVWTRGFDKRFCFDQRQLQSRIEYVRAQDHETD